MSHGVGIACGTCEVFGPLDAKFCARCGSTLVLVAGPAAQANSIPVAAATPTAAPIEAQVAPQPVQNVASSPEPDEARAKFWSPNAAAAIGAQSGPGSPRKGAAGAPATPQLS